MEWIVVISLIVIGLALIVIEIVFVPGTTVVGALGLISMVGGVFYSFKAFGNPVGWGVASGTFIVSAIVIVISLKSGVWKRFALDKSIQSKVNDNKPIAVKIGDTGLTLSALRPYGNVEFGEDKLEVTTLGEMVESNTEVKVIKIEGRNIYVEQLNS